jgi:hypothetical protein
MERKTVKTIIVGSIALALLIAASTSGHAQQVVRSEPPAGSLPSGAVVLVDDGTCGKDKIKQVTGGSNIGGRGGGASRQRTCIPR